MWQHARPVEHRTTEISMRFRSTVAVMADLLTIIVGLIVIAEKLF